MGNAFSKNKDKNAAKSGEGGAKVASGGGSIYTSTSNKTSPRKQQNTPLTTPATPTGTASAATPGAQPPPQSPSAAEEGESGEKKLTRRNSTVGFKENVKKYRHTDGTSRDSVPGGRGSAGGGASGGGGGQLEDGDLSNNEYYCSIRDASEDSPVRQHRMEEMRKQHYKENYVDFQHGKQLAQQTIQSTASKTPGLMESKNADGVGVVSSRQRDGSDEAGGAEETENTEDMLPPLRGGMEGEDNNGPLYCEPNSPSVVVGFKELRNKVEEDETGRLQRSAEVGEQKDPSSEFQSKRKAHYKTYVPFGSARRLASQTLEQEQQAGRGRENSLGEEVEGAAEPPSLSVDTSHELMTSLDPRSRTVVMSTSVEQEHELTSGTDQSHGHAHGHVHGHGHGHGHNHGHSGKKVIPPGEEADASGARPYLQRRESAISFRETVERVQLVPKERGLNDDEEDGGEDLVALRFEQSLKDPDSASKESSEFVAKRKEHYDTYMDLGQARRLARLALDAETGEPTITNTEGFTQDTMDGTWTQDTVGTIGGTTGGSIGADETDL